MHYFCCPYLVWTYSISFTVLTVELLLFDSLPAANLWAAILAQLGAAGAMRVVTSKSTSRSRDAGTSIRGVVWDTFIRLRADGKAGRATRNT